MAKRKKLNKRVVILLVIAGLVVCLGGLMMFFRALPKDPEALASKAQGAVAKGDFRAADRFYAFAASAAKVKPPYYIERSKLIRTWISLPTERTGLSESERIDYFNLSIDLIRQAVIEDPNYLEAQELLCEVYWERARQYRRWTDYIDEADKLLELAPDDHQTYNRRGIAKSVMAKTVGGERVEQAIADFRKAISLKKDEFKYWRDLASFYSLLDRKEQAYEVLDEALVENPNMAVARVYYASSLKADGLKEEAKKQLLEAVTCEPNNPLGNIALAEYYIFEGDFDSAVQSLEAARQIDESDYRIYTLLSGIFTNQGQIDQAITVIKTGLDVIDKKIEELGQGDEEVGKTGFQLTEASWHLNNKLANTLLDRVGKVEEEKREELIEEVRGCYEKVQMLTNDSSSRVKIAGKSKIAGRLALIDGDIVEATRLLEIAYVNFGRIDLYTANTLINLYLRQNRDGKAEEILNRVLDLPGQSNNPDIQLLKARLEIRRRDYDSALARVNQVLFADPYNTQAIALKQSLQIGTGQFEKLQPGMELTPDTIKMLVNRVDLMWLNEQHEEAISLLKDLHEQIPQNNTVLSKLINYYVAQDQVDKAKSLLESLLAAYPENAMAYEFQLKIISEQDPEKKYQIQIETIEQVKDPLSKALAKATIASIFGKEEEYAKYLLEAAEINPNEPNVIGRMVGYAITKKDWDLAQKWQEKASEANLDGVDGRMYSAQIAIAQEQFELAIEELADVTTERPDLSNAWVMLGECYLQNKEYAKSEEAFHTAYRNNPAHVTAVIGMARVTELQNKSDEFAEWIERANRLAPTDSYVKERHLAFQQFDAKAEDIPELIHQRELVLKREPGNLANRLNLARLYEVDNQLNKAESMLVYASKNAESDVAGARALVDFYIRTNQLPKAGETLTGLVAESEDQVGANVLYGSFLLRQNEKDKALAALNKAVLSDPEDSRGYAALASFYEQQNQWGLAANALDKYLEKEPQNLTQRKNQVRYQLEGAQYKVAEANLDGILAENPSDVEAITLKGILMLKQGEVQRARELLDRAIENNPDEFPEPYIYRGRLNLVLGEPRRAKDDLLKAQNMLNSPQIAIQLAGAYEAMGEPREAEVIYRELLTRPGREGFRPAITGLIRLYTTREAWEELEELLSATREIYPEDPAFLLSEVPMWEAREETQKKLQVLKSVLEMAPEWDLALNQYLNSLLEAGEYAKVLEEAQAYKDKPGFSDWVNAIRARAIAMQGDIQQADEIFMQAFKNVPDDRQGLVTGQIVQTYGIAKAIEKIEGWIASLPESPRNYAVLGMLSLSPEVGNDVSYLQKAEKAFLEAKELSPNKNMKAAFDLRLGGVYYQLKDFRKSEQLYLNAIDVLKNVPQAMNNLAYMYANDLGQPEKALPYAQQASRMLPNNANVLDTYGWTLYKLGKYSEAEEILLQCILLDGTKAVFRYHLGDIYLKVNRLDDAERQYRLAYEIVRDNKADPLYGEITRALELIEKRKRGEE